MENKKLEREVRSAEERSNKLKEQNIELRKLLKVSHAFTELKLSFRAA